MAQMKDREIKTVVIGPAGENRVRFATVTTDGGCVTGRTGLGAVLGAKKIKAIACRGTGDLEVKFPEQLLALGPLMVADAPIADIGIGSPGTRG